MERHRPSRLLSEDLDEVDTRVRAYDYLVSQRCRLDLVDVAHRFEALRDEDLQCVDGDKVDEAVVFTSDDKVRSYLGKCAHACFRLHRLYQCEVLRDIIHLHLAVPGADEDQLLGEMDALRQVALHVEGQVQGVAVEDVHVLV